MDQSIRLRTAEDGLADELAALKTLITPQPSTYTSRKECAVNPSKGRAAKFIQVPINQVEARHGNR